MRKRARARRRVRLAVLLLPQPVYVCVCAGVYTPYLPTCRDERGAREIGLAYRASLQGAQRFRSGWQGGLPAALPERKLLKAYRVYRSIRLMHGRRTY